MDYIVILLFLFLFSGCKKKETNRIPDFNGNNTYYLDNQYGNDNNDGLSRKKAWKSLARAGETHYKNGDKLLLKRGCRFAGTLVIQTDGSKENPVFIGAYPEKDTSLALPVIDAKGYLASIRIANSDFLEISNLEIVSDGGKPAEDKAQKRRYGVMAEAGAGHISESITLRNLYIHRIFASEEVPGEGQNPLSNMGMGICFISDSGASFRDIRIEKCRIERTGHTAIKLSAKTQDTALFIHNIRILDNRMKDIGGPGIQPGKCINVLVKGNTVDHSGSLVDPRMHGRGSGIWPWYCRNVLIEYNRFMYAHGKMDSHGAHIDYLCRDVVIQYNMSIENGGGFVEILGNNHNCSYRYNLSINDGWRRKGINGAVRDGEILFISNYTGKNEQKEGPYNSYIYNNTIYVKEDILSGFFLANTTDGLLVANNIFCILGKTHTTVRPGSEVPGAVPVNIRFLNNLYVHSALPADFPVQDSLPLYGDPGFANPGGMTPEDYIPANADIIKDKGILITKLPGDTIGLRIGLTVKKDFFGNEIYAKPDLGAVELK